MRFLALFSLLLLLAQCDDPDPNKPVLYMYVPSYGNQSTNGSYHLRFYGVIYQREDDNGFNNIFDGLFDDDDINDLNPTNARERANLNFTLDPFLHWELLSDQIITFNVQNKTDASTTKETSIDGQFDEFVNVQLNLTNLPQTIYYQAINPDDDGNLLGNITVHGPTGYSIMSDIDDVLRVTKAWEPQGLVNTFVKDMVAVDGMPQLFNQWKSQLNPAFHYCTETPIPLAGVLLRWMYTLYPFGSLDLRPVNILESDELLGARKDQVFRLAETYPNRKFILVGDTSSESVVRAFPEFARTFPNQTVCVFIKNTTAQFPHFFNPLVDLKKEFEGVPPEKWFVFDKASDLRSIVIQSGICRPPGIPINQTTISGGFGGTVTDAAHALTVHITLLVVFLMVLLA